MQPADYEVAMRVETQLEADEWLTETLCYFLSLKPSLGSVVFANGEPIRLPDAVMEPNPTEMLREIKRGLGYFAGYYSNETRERVERLFRCEHPFFGAIAEKGPPEDPMKIGFEMGQMLAKHRDGLPGFPFKDKEREDA